MEKKKLFTREKTKKLLYKMTFTAVFAALAVVVKSFTNLALNIPGVGIKIGFSGILTFFPAAFCGPLFGGADSALSDVLGYLVAPDGAYIPWLTLTAFCGGVIKGILWRLLTKKAEKKARKLPEGPERDNALKGAVFMKRILDTNSPRSLSMCGGAMMPFNFAKGFVELANGHLLKGIGSFMKKIKVPKLPKEEQK